MANDLSGVVCAVLLSNYCSSRKTRWIGIGMLILVVSALLPASSQLFVEVSNDNSGL